MRSRSLKASRIVEAAIRFATLTRSRSRSRLLASGLELVGLFIDAGISGAKDENERPGLREALAAITAGRADALVVSNQLERADATRRKWSAEQVRSILERVKTY